LEKYYEERSGVTLDQFGYNLLVNSKPPLQKTGKTLGEVQDTYILGSGDEISVTIRGQENLKSSVQVSSDGQLIIEDLAPISAAGRTIKNVREELQSLLGDYYNTDIFLSLTKTKQLNIRITGNVTTPGDITLSSYDTVMDALIAAGGVSKTGTLRQIKIIRGNSSSIIDLYGLLVFGSATSDITLRDGDTIQVGPIGPTIAISGAVKRAGIYEIPPAFNALWKENGETSQKLSLDDLLMLSSGPLAPGKLRYIRLTPDHMGRDTTEDIKETDLKIFRDGDILTILKGKEVRTNAVELSGNTRADGVYSIKDTPSLSYLLSDETILTQDTYPLIGIVERWNPSQLSTELISFSPKKIINGEADIRLRESDRVMLFTRAEIKSIGAPESGMNENALKLASLNTNAFGTSDIESDSQNQLPPSTLAPNIRHLLLEHSVFIRGSVRNSGSFPIANGTTLDSLLAAAGGPSLEASLGNIEITQPLGEGQNKRSNIDLSGTPARTIPLHPGDTIRINQKFRRIEDNHVLLVGEVRNPGTYDLLPGDTLSKLIERAGGITEQAYPKGAIFSRKTERLREEQRFRAQARDLELKLASALSQKNEDKKPDTDEVTLAQSLIADLKNAEALGRLTIEADPGMLAANPDMDILLETGDRIYVPKRPLTVRVAGEVLSPASLQFRSGKKPRIYIDEAGGFTYNADKDRAFVVYPDGSASPLAVSAWNHSADMIPPGSTIIVPRDPKPLTFMDGAKDLSQILANLATTAIFADDIADDN
jgi:protein involved in polysaccharide export with SLBB domain